jgi:excisionase family DNA binding protein
MTETITHSPTDSPWLTVTEAATFARCSAKLIYVACNRHDLRHARIGTGRGTLRIHRDWLRAWLEAASEPREVSRG